MRNQPFDFGPWTTSLDSGSRMQLSTFWKHRMSRLAELSRTVKMSRLTIAAALALAVLVSLSPLVELVPAAPADETPVGDFVARFSNGVTVELIGLSNNPSTNAKWWKPDGIPLEKRPYHNVMAHMGSKDSLAREVCWRWQGIGDADVQTNWGIKPNYNGAGGGRPVDQQGKPVDGLTAWAISLDGSPETCTVKLSMSVPAAPWQTQLKSQAGNSSSTGFVVKDGKPAGVSYLKPRVEGKDTIVTVGYNLAGEVRLAALDHRGNQHVGSMSGGSGVGGFMMREVRFNNVMPKQLKTWQFQTRQRKIETVEFRNVSLHRGKVTDVETVFTSRIPTSIYDSEGDLACPAKPSSSPEQWTGQSTCMSCHEIPKGEIEAWLEDLDIKLKNPTDNEEQKASPRLKLNQVVERTLYDRISDEKEYFLDLDTGLLRSLKIDHTLQDAEEWLIKHGVDVIGAVEQGSFQGLYGFDMIAIPALEYQWEPRRAVLSTLKEGKPGRPTLISGQGDLPATYVFQTREGSRGVLQILEITDDSAVKIRYKLLDIIAALPTSASDSPKDSVTKETAATDELNVGSDLLKQLRKQSTPILAKLVEKHGYRLPEGQSVQRVAPPFPDGRLQYYRAGHPTQAKAVPRGPDSMLFRWEGLHLRNWGMSFGTQSVVGVLSRVTGIKSHEIEGPQKLLKTEVTGDWIVEPTQSQTKIVADLETILRDDCELPIRLQIKSVEREVYVVSGDYQFSPLPDQPDEETMIYEKSTTKTDPIQIFGKQLYPNSGGGGTGDFNTFLKWLGRWIKTPLVNEVQAGPQRELTWRLNKPSPFTDQQMKEATDPDLVLPNITKQTGLTFSKETRTIKILFVNKDQVEKADTTD